jgi:hypothetical protein
MGRPIMSGVPPMTDDACHPLRGPRILILPLQLQSMSMLAKRKREPPAGPSLEQLRPITNLSALRPAARAALAQQRTQQ